MRSNLPHRQRDGAVVETPDYYVAQAYNGHIQVYDKTTKGMVMHISCTAMYPKEKLQAFADRLQAANSRSIEQHRGHAGSRLIPQIRNGVYPLWQSSAHTFA